MYDTMMAKMSTMLMAKITTMLMDKMSAKALAQIYDTMMAKCPPY